MKRTILAKIMAALMAVLIILPSFASTEININPVPANNVNPLIQKLNPAFAKLTTEEFLKLTPSKVAKMTGKKLTLKQTLELKAVQKLMKAKTKKGGDISKGLYIAGAILGFAWILMGIMDEWSGSDWIVNLVLYILCYLPGVIHAFIKMKKYYS
jgi:uncharacterized membrane protein YqaE (UPF0057 family)